MFYTHAGLIMHFVFPFILSVIHYSLQGSGHMVVHKMIFMAWGKLFSYRSIRNEWNRIWMLARFANGAEVWHSVPLYYHDARGECQCWIKLECKLKVIAALAVKVTKLPSVFTVKLKRITLFIWRAVLFLVYFKVLIAGEECIGYTRELQIHWRSSSYPTNQPFSKLERYNLL